MALARAEAFLARMSGNPAVADARLTRTVDAEPPAFVARWGRARPGAALERLTDTPE